MLPWVDGYIGIPYLEHGRDAWGCDCWGLVRMILAEQFGVELPSVDGYSEVNPGATKRLVSETLAAIETTVVDAPEPGDIVLMRLGPHPSAHVGVVVAPGLMVHTDRGINSTLARLDAPLIRNRIEGYYRVC